MYKKKKKMTTVPHTSHPDFSVKLEMYQRKACFHFDTIEEIEAEFPTSRGGKSQIPNILLQKKKKGEMISQSEA